MSVPHIFLIFCVCSNLKNKFTNEFSRCRNGCKHSLAPKNGSEIAFQGSVLLLFRFETNVGIMYLLTKTSWRQTVSITCVTLLLHFSDVRFFLTSFNNAKMADALYIAVLIFLHNI